MNNFATDFGQRSEQASLRSGKKKKKTKAKKRLRDSDLLYQDINLSNHNHARTVAYVEALSNQNAQNLPPRDPASRTQRYDPQPPRYLSRSDKY